MGSWTDIHDNVVWFSKGSKLPKPCLLLWFQSYVRVIPRFDENCQIKNGVANIIHGITVNTWRDVCVCVQVCFETNVLPY